MANFHEVQDSYLVKKAEQAVSKANKAWGRNQSKNLSFISYEEVKRDIFGRYQPSKAEELQGFARWMRANDAYLYSRTVDLFSRATAYRKAMSKKKSWCILHKIYNK